LRKQSLGQTARAIAATGKPKGFETLVVRDLEKGLRPDGVVTREMPAGKKTLRMKVDLDALIRIEAGGDLLDPVRDARLDARSRRHDADLGIPSTHSVVPRFQLSCQTILVPIVISG
jgi:hypothetical protein